MQKRKYHDYDEYLVHQAKKSLSADRKKRLTGGLSVVRTWIFRERFKNLKHRNAFKEGDSGLCLGARYGEEVRGLKSAGCQAVGIDLVECLPDVIQGDFHDIPFPDNHFDFVYTNSLDHAYDLKKIFSEVSRVLKDNSYFCIDCDFGAYGKHESFEITELNDLILALSKNLDLLDCLLVWDTRGNLVRECIIQKIPKETNKIQKKLETEVKKFMIYYSIFTSKILKYEKKDSKQLVEMLVQDGEITEEDINSAFENWIKMFPEEDKNVL